jgi:hypothetical protein
MSSVQSAFASIQKLPTKFSSMISPAYEDTSIVTGRNIIMPIPFNVVNSVLDINVNQSASIQTFVNNGTNPENEPNIQGKAFGGVKLVTSFGPNMETYLRNWIANIEEDAYTGPLVLYIQPSMTKVQLANPKFAIPSDVEIGELGGPFVTARSWGVTTEAPVSGEYTGGGTPDNFFTAWIFKTPITIQYVASGGGFKYITMTSQFAED